MAAITLRTSGGARQYKVGFDWWMLGAAAFLILVGILSIFSANSDAGAGAANAKRQIVNMGVGMVPLLVFGLVNPRFWSRISVAVYATNIILLILVMVAGKEVDGAERWLKLGPLTLQPSEISKLFCILTLATFYANRRERIKELSTFLLGALHMFVPTALIFLQPHLGASILMLALWLAVSLVMGVKPKFIVITVAIFGFLVGVLVGFPQVRNALLQPYQVKRVDSLLKKLSGVDDSKKSGYQVARGLEAISNGGVTGTGYLKGEYKKRVPKQHTDFIFSLIGEEFGLLGSGLILSVFGLLFYRLWLGIINAIDPYYQGIMAGILTVLVFHTVVNVGMVLGMLPVVGLWCPFLSYGGTALHLCMGLVALGLRVRSGERAVLF